MTTERAFVDADLTLKEARARIEKLRPEHDTAEEYEQATSITPQETDDDSSDA
jgi:hypothetical protein